MGPIERHALEGVFLECLAIGGNRLLKPLGSALTPANRQKRVAEIVLGHGPFERHALAGAFLESLANGCNRLLQPLCPALTLARRSKRVEMYCRWASVRLENEIDFALNLPCDTSTPFPRSPPELRKHLQIGILINTDLI
jgi:hypothetical protein